MSYRVWHKMRRNLYLYGLLLGVALTLPVAAACNGATATPPPARAGFDLRRLAGASGTHFELGFFPLLRQELRQQLAGGPRVVHLTGLRACVKRLTATQRWCPRCRALHVQILAFLRHCLRESGVTECSLVVE